jgi:hypothetical protein
VWLSKGVGAGADALTASRLLRGHSRVCPSLAGFVLAVLAAMAFGSSAAEASTPCAKRGDKTIARNSVARVFEEGAIRKGCTYRRNHVYEITVDEYPGRYLGPTRLAGHVMAHAGSSAVDIRNLRTGRLRAVGNESENASAAFDLELKRTGAFADVRSIGRGPISNPGDPYAPRGALIFEIRRVDSRGPLVLARGSDINANSLVRRGNYIRWKQAGAVHQATLR